MPVVGRVREPEIENLDCTGDVENDVGRLDIAVNDPFGASEVQAGEVTTLMMR